MHISTSSYLFSNSIVLALELYFRERSSTLYIVITAGKVVKVNSYAIGRVVIVKLGLATGKVVKVNQL